MNGSLHGAFPGGGGEWAPKTWGSRPPAGRFATPLGRRAASPRRFPGPGRQGKRACPPRAGSLHCSAVTPERLRNPTRLAPAGRLGRAALLGVLLAAAVSLGATPNGTRPGTGPLVIPPHPPLYLALHQGGQPAHPRGRRVRRAGPRLARGPRAAHLPAERGRDTAPLRRPPRPRAHELLRDRRPGRPPGRARTARARPRAHLPRAPSLLAERGERPARAPVRQGDPGHALDGDRPDPGGAGRQGGGARRVPDPAPRARGSAAPLLSPERALRPGQVARVGRHRGGALRWRTR